MPANQTAPYAAIAVSFAEALTSGNFCLAHAMLSSALCADMPQDQLRRTYAEMIQYGDGPPTEVELMETLETWPARQPLDLGWAYVAISGNNYSEAVAVIVGEEFGAPVIRKIEWGRP